MLFSTPRSTAGTGVAYSCGYNFRSASIAAFTRSSSAIDTVLIQVIYFPFGKIVIGKSIGSRRSRYSRASTLPSRGFLCLGRSLRRIQRDGNVFVNRLPLVIVVRMILPVRTGDGL